MKPHEIQSLWDSGKQMGAVKELRAMTKCGLIEARNALMDGRAQDLCTKSFAQVYLRDAHSGKGDECWVPCAKGDPGAVLFIPA